MDDPASKTALNAQQLRAIFTAFDGSALIVLDPHGTITFYNERAAHLAAAWPDIASWLRAPFHDPETRCPLDAEANVWHRVQNGTRPAAFIAAYLDPTGAERILEFAVRNSGLDDLTLVTATEITRSYQDTVSRRRDTGHDMMMHDMGNVLGIIQMAAEGIRRATLPEDAQSKLAHILGAVQRGNNLLGQVSEDRDQSASADLSKVLRRASSMFERVLPSRITFTCDWSDRVHVKGYDLDALETCLIEVLCAARRYLLTHHAAHGSIRTDISQNKADVIWTVDAISPGGAAASVASQGAGAVPPSELFALAQSVEAALGGTLSVVPGAKGSVSFKVHMSSADTIEDSEVCHPVEPEPDLQGYVICVADSEEASALALASRLELSGAHVSVVSSAQALETRLRDTEPLDVVLMGSSTLDGTPAVRVRDMIALARANHPAPVRLLVHSRRSMDALVPRDVPVFALHLSKPVSGETLINAIRLAPAAAAAAAAAADETH